MNEVIEHHGVIGIYIASRTRKLPHKLGALINIIDTHPYINSLVLSELSRRIRWIRWKII